MVTHGRRSLRVYKTTNAVAASSKLVRCSAGNCNKGNNYDDEKTRDTVAVE